MHPREIGRQAAERLRVIDKVRLQLVSSPR
jgi:hypothetical protein